MKEKLLFSQDAANLQNIVKSIHHLHTTNNTLKLKHAVLQTQKLKQNQMILREKEEKKTNHFASK